MKSGDTLSLSFGLQFEDLYTSEGLAKVDVAFQRYLATGDAALLQQMLAARVDPKALARKAESELILAIAPHLEDFLGELFQIQKEIRALQHQHEELAPLYTVKRNFVQRKALTAIKETEAQHLLSLLPAFAQDHPAPPKGFPQGNTCCRRLPTRRHAMHNSKIHNSGNGYL